MEAMQFSGYIAIPFPPELEKIRTNSIHDIVGDSPRIGLPVEKLLDSQIEAPRVRLVQNRGVRRLQPLSIANLHLPAAAR